MEKLSRKDKYRDLRSTLENSGEKSETPKAAPKTVRMAAPDVKAESRRGPGTSGNPVIEDLLGEVTQYNLDNGEIVSEDTQLQILHDLSEESQASQRRNNHLEQMEVNEDAGGTTRNIYGSDFSEILYQPDTNSSKPFTLDVDESETAQETIEPDYLDLFTPAASEPEMDIDVISAVSTEQPAPKSKRAGKIEKAKASAEAATGSVEEETLEQPTVKKAPARKNRKAKAKAKPARPVKKEIQAPAEEIEEVQDDKKAGKASMIFMAVCSVILVILIILTLYWMSQLGIF